MKTLGLEFLQENFEIPTTGIKRKRKRAEMMEDESKNIIAADSVMNSLEESDSITIIKSFRQGDDMWKNIYHAGVTPNKIQRTIKAPVNPTWRVLFSDANDMTDIAELHKNAIENEDKYDSDEEWERLALQFKLEANNRGSMFDQDFEELWTIGRGQFGSVVKWRNKLDGHEYAIKITDKVTPKSGHSIEEAKQEVYTLSLLSTESENQYVVRYYRGWIEDDQLYMQMELCEKSLYDLFLEQNYNEVLIMKILRDIWLGLNELHERGIVHLDLKLENVLISKSGKFKLGDLGFSRLINKLRYDVPEGDTRYLAKELLNTDYNGPLPDLKKADIFSLGILAYELIDRRRAQSKCQEWHDLREGKITFHHPELYSKSTLEMVKLMLSPNPDCRPTTSELLNKYLPSAQEKELRLYKLITKMLIKNQILMQ